MEHQEFNTLLQKHFAEMTNGAHHLYEVNVDKDELWALYLDSFPAGTNVMYRKRREFDCSCCRQFIKALGNVVAIIDGKVMTIWDFETGETMFQPVVNALSAFIKANPICAVWVPKVFNIGTSKNYENIDGHMHEWHHLWVQVPSNFIDRSARSIGDLQGAYRDTRNVLKRSLDELSEDSVLTILELIAQNSLYKGEEWNGVLHSFLALKREYDALPDGVQRDLYVWDRAGTVGGAVGRIRNHSIGVLLQDVSSGMDLDAAVRRYEQIVAPANYKRPKAIFTQKMLEDAKKTVNELGYINSLGRRFATLADISVNNILFSNKDAAAKMSPTDLFDSMESSAPITPKKFSKVEELAAQDFVDKVLPTASEVEVLLEGRHIPNMVSLIAPKDATAPSMFKWNNPFGWAYAGNITDSTMKENVKSAGGKVDGVLRFSIQWNDIEVNTCDYDAHCVTPFTEIYYANRYDRTTGGKLDVDIISPHTNIPAVENITWADKGCMRPGEYRFFVHNFHCRTGSKGFRAEIEFDGQVYSYECARPIRHGERVPVATVTLDKHGSFSISEKLPSTLSVREVWGVNTNRFVPVSVVMYSPNYWDEQTGIGHRHYMFMLKDCKNPDCPNGFYNEFLKEELLQHKRVFEALGSKAAVKPSDDQLSGVGFSSSKRNELIVKVKGQTERIMKIKF